MQRRQGSTFACTKILSLRPSLAVASRKPIFSRGIELQHGKFISHNVFINLGTRCVLGVKIQFKDCEVQRLQLFCVELPQIAVSL